MSSLKEIHVPNLGDNISNAVVTDIYVKEGDTVEKGDGLIGFEANKVMMDIPSELAGIIKKVKVKKDDKISTGDLILILEIADSAVTAEISAENVKEQSSLPVGVSTKSSKLQEIPSRIAEDVTADATSNRELSEEDDDDNGDIHAGPGVRRLAREFGIDLNKITGTGQKGRIVKEDLQKFVKAQLKLSSNSNMGLPVAPEIDFSQFGLTEKQPLSRIKKLSGHYLHRNWLLVPHVTQFNEADITELEAFRKAQAGYATKHNVKLTPLAFIMKAVVTSLKAFPTFNASLSADGEQLILKKYFHIGIAVDTADGLVVPVIRDVDKKSLLELAQELATVSKKAREKQLSSADMQGNSFTISSLGGIGGTAFTPIVNVPDVAILGVSKTQYKPLYQEGEFIPRLMLPLSLSYDHRVIDGAEGARFIVHLTECLSDMRRWLL